MRRPSRDVTISLAFALLAFAVAFAQRPGWATSDTKIDLHVDPAAFLGQVASLWSPRIGFGAVQSAQYSGYLWPMGSFFAALHAIGLSSWVVERMWLGTIYALSAWGMLRLLDLLIGRPRGVAHVVAALFFMLNPYTVIFTGRTSITLVGYAALPWLLAVVHQGVRSVPGLWRGARGWAWAGAFALILTSLGGGINAAVVAWMLVGPLVLLVYEPLVGAVRWRDSAVFTLRLGGLGLLASLWWLVPLLQYSRYGVNFLQYTEQPFTIWATNSSTEVLRLMAYWTSYIGVGFHGFMAPYSSEGGVLLFNPLVVGASLLLPALAVAAFVWCKRSRYAPFLLLLILVAAVIEVAAFPTGTPARGAGQWIYDHVPSLRFLRTTQKAAPLVAVGLGGLLGLGAQFGWGKLRALPRRRLTRLAPIAAAGVLVALILLAALPLVRGTAVEKQLAWKRIPAAWTSAGRDLDRTLAPNTRAIVLPGQLFAYYTWGGTIDPILPRLTSRPVAVREETPYEDPHAADLLIEIDSLVQQARLFPGELTPLLRLAGVGAVITGSDDDTKRSGAVDPYTAAATLAAQGLGQPNRGYGPAQTLPPPAGDIGPARRVNQVRRYNISGSRGIVHVDPTGPPTILDGSADGLAETAAFGALPARAPILYAGDLTAAQIRAEATPGANVVITDSDQRRDFLAQFVGQDVGPVLQPDQPFGENSESITPFPARGQAGQTVAILQGASYLSTPAQVGYPDFPEHAPIAAFDGNPATSWTADRYLPPADRWIQIGFSQPRAVPFIDLDPIRDPYGIEEEVDVNGVKANLGPGITRVWLHQRHVTSVRVTIIKVKQPPGNVRGSGGFREIGIPGVHVRQLLRPPVLAADALAGRNLRAVGLTYILQRTTADEPFEVDPSPGSPLLELPQDRQDPEPTLARELITPVARSYAVDAWVYPGLDTPDSVLDRLAGVKTADTFESSARFHNQARYRASSAFDGQPGTAWVAGWAPPSAPPPWIAWSTAAPETVSRLTLGPAPFPVRRPTVVRISWSGGETPRLPVASDGAVRLPRPVTTRGVRITVLAAAYPAGTSNPVSAVGIGEIAGPGVPAVRVARSGPLHSACGDAAITVAGRRLALVDQGTIGALDGGDPLRAYGCGGRVAMGAGVQEVDSLNAPLSVDLLRLSSPAPVVPVSGGGRVVDPGHESDDGVKDARVALTGPSWLVLGESFSKGWSASCNGRSLGTPIPIDGYANGWRAPVGCHSVSFSFAPQRTAWASYAISALICVLLCALLLVVRPRARVTREPAGLLPDDTPIPMPLIRSAFLAAVATVPLCLLFALRTSLVIFPVLTFALFRGLGARRLTAVAAGLLGVVVPIAYAIESPKNLGGYNFDYSVRTIDAHWVGVLALVLLMVACGRTLAAARRARPPAQRPPAGEAPSGEAPSGEAPSGEAPSGQAPSGEAPAERAPWPALPRS